LQKQRPSRRRSTAQADGAPREHRALNKCQEAFLAVCLFTVIVTFTPVTLAQDAPPAPSTAPGLKPPPSVPGPAPGRAPVPRREPEPSAPAYRAGSFLLYPDIVLTEFYDSNVFYTNSIKLSDWATVLTPSLYGESDWARHSVTFQLGWEGTRYNEYESEDTDDYRASLEGRYDISVDTNVYGGFRYSRDHEDRESPDARNGFRPTIFYAKRGYAGVYHQFSRFSVRIAATILGLNFEDTPFLNGIINQDDRDRTHYTGGARFGYELSPRSELFLQAAIDNRRYKTTPDDLGFFRDSDGQRWLIGARLNRPGKVKAELFGGYLRQDYEDPRLADVSKPAFGANVLWQALPETTVSFYVDRTVEETTVFTLSPLRSASSYLNTYAGIGVDHRLADQFGLYGSASFARVDYQGIDRRDDYPSVAAGLSYTLSRHFIVDTSIRYRWLDSSIPGEDFAKRQVFVRLIIPLVP